VKVVEMSLPETAVNRRRQHFQGCLPMKLNGSEAMETHDGEALTSNVN
jgi:hypothetical protein